MAVAESRFLDAHSPGEFWHSDAVAAAAAAGTIEYFHGPSEQAVDEGLNM